LKNRPWEHQEGGEVPPNNGNKKNGYVNLISVSKLAAQERKVIASAMWIITRKPVSALSPAKRKVITSRSSGAKNPKLGRLVTLGKNFYLVSKNLLGVDEKF
jgi:hypothetical protein